jgi:hypothetical protein
VQIVVSEIFGPLGILEFRWLSRASLRKVADLGMSLPYWDLAPSDNWQYDIHADPACWRDVRARHHCWGYGQAGYRLLPPAHCDNPTTLADVMTASDAVGRAIVPVILSGVSRGRALSFLDVGYELVVWCPRSGARFPSEHRQREIKTIMVAGPAGHSAPPATAVRGGTLPGVRPLSGGRGTGAVP